MLKIRKNRLQKTQIGQIIERVPYFPHFLKTSSVIKYLYVNYKVIYFLHQWTHIPRERLLNFQWISKEEWLDSIEEVFKRYLLIHVA